MSFFSSRRRHTRCSRDWSSDVCSSDLVKQTQKVEGRVGIFHVPVNVEITTASGPRLYPITVSKAEQVFTLPSDSAPLMVLFDKANRVLKSTEFHKEKKEWLYQLKNAGEFAEDRKSVV